MINRILGWLQAVLAYLSGHQAGEEAIRFQEIRQDDEVAHAVIQADADAPRDRAAVAEQLRAAEF